MGYENDPYRDEDGEPLMDYDDVQSDRGQSPEPHQEGLYDDLEEDIDDWRGRDRSQTPVYDNDSSMSKTKPRKRLIKKSDTGKQAVPPELVDEDDGDALPASFVRDGSEDEDARKRKKGKDGTSGKKEKRHKGEKKFGSSGKSGSKFGLSKKGFAGKGGKDHDGEVKEMWDTIAGGDSEVLPSDVF